VARVHIPPLRARKTDIPLLVLDFLRSANAMTGKTIDSLDAAAMQCLLDYDWPGNVRELRACIDFASIHCRGSQVRVGDLPPEIRQASAVSGDQPAPSVLFNQASGLDDASLIRSALQQTRGNRTRAAVLLGMSRATFYRRLRELGLNPEE
jgi:DNA-binding NtrC family response regulator